MNSQYCSKCSITNNISTISIFNIVNDIINTSTTSNQIYTRLDQLKFPLTKWLEFNEDGYNVFQWFAWFISTNIKKNSHLKPKVFAFFQKILSDRSVETKSIFSKNQILSIIQCGTSFDNNHSLLYHLVRYCENANDHYYGKLYKLLIDNNTLPLTDEQLIEIKNSITIEENIPADLKVYIDDITNKYKNIEQSIITQIITKYTNYNFDKCAKCNQLVNFINEIPKIINFAKSNNYILLLNMIWLAYYQRKLLNMLFNRYYESVDSRTDLNKIHSRHLHILKVYTSNLMI